MARIAYAHTDVRAQQRLIDSLWDLLETTPFRRITITQLAEAAHCNRATLYYHNEDANDLLQKALEHELVHEAGVISALADELSGKDVSTWSVGASSRLTLLTRQVDRSLLSEKLQVFSCRLWSLVLCQNGEDLSEEAAQVVAFMIDGMLGTYAKMQQLGAQECSSSVRDLVLSCAAKLGELYGVSDSELPSRLRMVERICPSLS